MGTISDLVLSEFTRHALLKNRLFFISDILPIIKIDLVKKIGQLCYDELFPELRKYCNQLLLWEAK